ncbi:MAG: sigma-54-dependent Fis family transcriptional regulator [Deltaproteobacteria bacterium]|nr:sigma-54-dependent Fis family transcriptional regulator [Deltaproteobacteria bacterium]
MTTPTTVLVVDDERSNLQSLERIFEREGMRTLTAGSAREALEACRGHRVHVALIDLMMPGGSGLDLLRALRTVSPDTEVVLMTAYGTVETAVEAMKEGAYDFVEKPLKRMSIVKTVRKAAEKQSLVAENKSLRAEVAALKSRPIVGSSPALRQALEMALQAAPSSATVLILGESGTGKELLARYVHERSNRATGPFVGVNLAALPETIVESELFGHEKGAFTGAIARREGRIAQASGGTLFLDEIGELSAAVQVKLLRVLQEAEYEPVGGRTQKADFRLLAATHRNLESDVAAGRFREDLYWRLNVISIVCPRLSDRREDIPLLVDHFLDVFAKKHARPRISISRAALDRMLDYGWPGNVRELENAIERAVVMAKGTTLGVDDLPRQIADAQRKVGQIVVTVGTPLDTINRRVLHETLLHTKGDKRLAAQLLGISTRSIYRWLEDDQAGPVRSERDEAE